MIGWDKMLASQHRIVELGWKVRISSAVLTFIDGREILAKD